MHKRADMVTKYLQVPEVARGSHYSERSGLIVLQGPRGPLLAQYTTPSIPPDPERFKFQTTYPRNYTTYDKAEPPQRAPGDVLARARPIEKTVDPRMSVQSGTTGDPISGSSQSRKNPSLMYTPNQGRNQDMTELRGVEVSEAQTEMRGADSGMRVGDKVRVEGGLENPSTTTKGMTRESPLRGILPETAVTFPGASMLPDLDKIARLQQIVTIIRKLPRLMRNVVRAAERLTG